MKVAELVQSLRDQQVEPRVVGEALRFDGPVGRLPAAVRRQLVDRKGELLLFLRDPTAEATKASALASPLAVGRSTLRNRIVLSPMEVDFGDRDGRVTERAIDYYAERARGGAGMVVVEASSVDADVGRLSPHQLRVDRDEAIPGLAALARAVRSQGAVAALQLHHAGRKTSVMVTGQRPVAPSPVPNHLGETPRELAEGEISALVERFAAAALRAQIAGFDAVEIHAAHGYLHAQFLSPTYNRREDGYGGSPENRRRFLLETVEAIRARVGRHFPVFCRLTALELTGLELAGDAIGPLEGGLELAETLELVPRLEAAGVAMLDLSATLVGAGRQHPMAWPEALLAPHAEAVKRRVGIPVSVTSRVPLAVAEELVASQRLDLVRFGRPLLADPELPAKWLAGRADTIRPCIFCSVCLDPDRRQPGATCVVNPRLGNEGAVSPPLVRRKRVVVVGGGPAGMEAAAEAARRGHQVLLLERESELGGQLRLRSKPAKVEATYRSLLEFLRREVARNGVEVRVGAEVGPADLAGLAPDTLVLATGSRAAAAGIAGASFALTAAEVLAGADLGARVAVVGGGLVGGETALSVAAQGREVTLFERGDTLAALATGEVRAWLGTELESRGASVRFGVEVIAIERGGGLRSRRAGTEANETFDTVVLAAGAEPVAELWPEASAIVAEVVRIGDCREPKDLQQALREGFEAARRL